MSFLLLLLLLMKINSLSHHDTLKPLQELLLKIPSNLEDHIHQIFIIKDIPALHEDVSQ